MLTGGAIVGSTAVDPGVAEVFGVVGVVVVEGVEEPGGVVAGDAAGWPEQADTVRPKAAITVQAPPGRRSVGMVTPERYDPSRATFHSVLTGAPGIIER